MIVPENGCHNHVLAKQRVVSVGLHPDAMAIAEIRGRPDRVENAKDHDQNPGERHEDAVDVEGERAVGLSFGKRVDWR